MTKTELIERLGLEPHPEGGWYRRTWQAPATDGQRASGSAIYYLITRDEMSRRHRVDAAEIWHHYRGAPVELRTSRRDLPDRVQVLGPKFEQGQEPQVTVPPRTWQEARSLGAYSLVGCTVSPAFEFAGFELAGDGAPPEAGTDG